MQAFFQKKFKKFLRYFYRNSTVAFSTIFSAKTPIPVAKNYVNTAKNTVRSTPPAFLKKRAANNVPIITEANLSFWGAQLLGDCEEAKGILPLFAYQPTDKKRQFLYFKAYYRSSAVSSTFRQAAIIPTKTRTFPATKINPAASTGSSKKIKHTPATATPGSINSNSAK